MAVRNERLTLSSQTAHMGILK